MGRTAILVGTESGLHAVGASGLAGLDGQSVGALAVGRDSTWAITNDDTLWRSESYGYWERVDGLGEFEAACILALADGVLVGTAEAHLLRLDGSRLRAVPGFDKADGRDVWYTPWGGPADVRSMTLGQSGSIYVNVHVGGVVRSVDGGITWRPSGLDIHSDAHQVLCHPVEPGRVFAAAAYGLAVSLDGGDTWRIDREGMHAGYCRAVAIAGENLLVTASRGPDGGDAALYRRPLDSDGAFAKCAEGLPKWFTENIDTHCLAGFGDVAAFGTEDGAVFSSPDAGRTWEEVARGLPAVRCLAIIPA